MTDAWRANLLLLLYFPGAIALAGVVEHFVLAPMRVQRAAESQAAFWSDFVSGHEASAPALLRLGISERDAGRRQEAHEAFEQILRIDPSAESAAVGLNGIVRSENGTEASIAQLEAFLAENPGCIPCSQNLAFDYFTLGNLGKARRNIDRVIAHRGYTFSLVYGPLDHRQGALVLAARIYDASGEASRALELLEEARRRNPLDPAAERVTAVILQRTDPEAAKPHWQRLRLLTGEAAPSS
jgi:tetratricopeptide (TPR) repeat protein